MVANDKTAAFCCCFVFFCLFMLWILDFFTFNIDITKSRCDQDIMDLTPNYFAEFEKRELIKHVTRFNRYDHCEKRVNQSGYICYRWTSNMFETSKCYFQIHYSEIVELDFSEFKKTRIIKASIKPLI